MKIVSADLQMASSHVSLQQHEVKESLKIWIGQRRPNFASDEDPNPSVRAEIVNLSEAGKAA